MKKIILLISLSSFLNCISQINEIENEKNQKSIIREHLGNALKYKIFSKDYQDNIDLGLRKDSTISYLWQQKAMPYFKSRKYEIGMIYIDKAVKYDDENYQPYRAFIKCIFAKTYKEAIIDFEDCIKKFGNNYVMDHTYGFYIGLCYLQLNEFTKAEKQFKEYNEDIFRNRQGLEHPTALFYYGISKYELQKWDEAILEFDKALKIYPNLSDAEYYKSQCLIKLGKVEESSILFEQAKKDAEKGYTINEDNIIYEKYPYQVLWH
jgi:tetratricopeptide (TPR) repeat protein